MSEATHDKKASAGATALSLHVAGACSPTNFDRVDEVTAPDESQRNDDAFVNGADLLERVHDFLTRFLSLPDYAAAIMALWAAHAHLMVSDTTPRLAFISAETACGKSLAMRLLALLCPRPLGPTSGTAASFIRALSEPKRRPTYFLDTLNTRFGPKAKGDEELRTFMEMGHQKDGYITRSEQTNKEWYTVKTRVFAAMSIAAIGDIFPDTILTRCIVIKMRKRLPDEMIETFRQRESQHLGHALRDDLAKWTDHHREAAASNRPALPDEIVDRDADVWEPLIVVADLAGGRWPDLARQAAISSVEIAKVNNKPSDGVRLLTDIRTCFGTKDKLSSRELVDMLLAVEESSWNDLGFRKKLDQYILAEMLREYGIRPRSVRLPDGSTPKGYRRSDFLDVWERHLQASPVAATGATDATSDESVENTGDFAVADNSHPPPCGDDGRIVAEPDS